MYVPELDRIVLKDACGQRPFANTQTNRKAVITTRVLGLVHELCQKRIHVTKRDLFYTDVKLFQARTRRPRLAGLHVSARAADLLLVRLGKRSSLSSAPLETLQREPHASAETRI
jgi:DNA topoisomerase VI subunit A